jgi:taurine--2-oxoglutarate transaminase
LAEQAMRDSYGDRVIVRSAGILRPPPGARAEHYFANGHTYEAHPLALAAGVAGIGEYKRLGLIDRSRKLGERLGKQLHTLQENHSSVGDARGLGLFWAFELVRNKDTKQQLNSREDNLVGRPMMADIVGAECLRNGTYISTWLNYLIIAPPLIIEEDEVNQGVSCLDKSLCIADREMKVDGEGL